MHFNLNLPKELVVSFTSEDIDINELTEEEKIICEQYEEVRKRDFIKGRYCAHECLLKLHNFQAIKKERNGAPVWPKGVIGSISHTQSLVGAMVTRTQYYLSIGLDIERIGRITCDLWPILFTRNEIGFLKKYQLAQQQLLSTVLFSIKEAYFKMQYVIANVVDMEPNNLEVTYSNDRFQVNSNIKLPHRLTRNVIINYQIVDDLVISYTLAKG